MSPLVACPFPPFMGQDLQPLAAGVWGLTRDDPDGSLVVVMIVAEQEGTGAVGKYLDALPVDRRVIVEACISLRLAGMLERRGFVEQQQACFDPATNEWTDGFVRSAA